MYVVVGQKVFKKLKAPFPFSTNIILKSEHREKNMRLFFKQHSTAEYVLLLYSYSASSYTLGQYLRNDEKKL